MDYRIVDVFAETALAGNPLAVVTDPGLDGAARQAIARETNLSETTFVGSVGADGSWPVRIHTPGSELPFAGHPVLGTAWVIRERHAPGADLVRLSLQAGIVPVFFGSDGVAWLDAPEVRLGECVPADLAARALGLSESDLDPDFPAQVLQLGPAATYVPLRTADALERASCSAERSRALETAGAQGSVYAFTRETRSPDDHVQARFFAPGLGVGEDPATGSAAACLGAYVREHGYLGEGPEVFHIEQGHWIHRPSLLRVRIHPTLQVGGRIHPVARGHLEV